MIKGKIKLQKKFKILIFSKGENQEKENKEILGYKVKKGKVYKLKRYSIQQILKINGTLKD